MEEADRADEAINWLQPAPPRQGTWMPSARRPSY